MPRDQEHTLYPVNLVGVRALAERLKRGAGNTMGDFVFLTISDANLIQHYSVPNGADAVERIVALVQKIGAEPHQNTYHTKSLFKSGSVAGNEGRTKANVILVLGATCDFDEKNDPATRHDRMPLPPSLEIETSPGNIQSHFWFDPPLSPQEAEPLLRALADVSKADDCKTTEHPWRCPGTWNWPNAKKLAAGRSPEPFLTRWESSALEETVAPADLHAAILTCDPSAFDRARKDGSASEFDGEWRRWPGKPPVTASEEWIVQSLAEPLDGRADRSTRLRSVEMRLLNRNYSIGEIVSLLEQHGDAWAVKGTGNWLRADVQRARDEWQAHPEFQDHEPPRDDEPLNEKFARAAPHDEPFVFIRDRATQLNSPAAEMQVETIVPWKKLILPWGDTDAGKTYWSVELVTAIAMDRPAFGRFQVLKPGPVIIFAGEDSDRLEQSRLTAIEHHYGKPLQGLVYTVETAIPVDDPDLFEKYCDEMRRLEKKIGPIAAVLNDTLKRSLGSLKPNDGEVGQRFTMAMEALIHEFKCTVITNAHQPKSGAEGGIAGTKSFTDNAPVTPHLIRLGEKPFDIRCEFEPKYRVGPRPAPFEVRGEAVLLPKPVAGVSTDLVFAALAPDALRRAYRPDMAGRGEAAEFTAIMDERGAHDVLHGLTTDDLADAIVGPPAKWGSLDKYRQEFGKVRARLDAGSRGKKQRNGKVSPARYVEWCDRDYREGGKGVLRWFCLAPHLRAAPPQHDELGDDPMHKGGTEK